MAPEREERAGAIGRADGSRRAPVHAAWLGALLGALVLALQAPLFAPTRLHAHGLVTDQAAYLTTAWSLVDEGRLANGIVYPALVERPELRTYMPGSYLVLAASDVLLGRGVLAALAPGLVGFVLCAAGAAWLAARRAIAGRVTAAHLIEDARAARRHALAAGLAAALLFALFPASQLWAFSAMAESSFSAAAVLALIGFELVPARRRWLAVPLLLALPFLFRETGALLVLLLATRLAFERAGSKRTLLALLASVALLGALQAWQVADGKLPLPLGWIAEGGFNYGRIADEPPALAWSALPAALARNAERNLALLAHQLRTFAGELRGWGTLVVSAAVLACSAAGLHELLRARRRARLRAQRPDGFEVRGEAPRHEHGPGREHGHGQVQGQVHEFRPDGFALGTALCALALLGLTFALYDVGNEKLVRGFAFLVPALSVVLGGALVSALARLPRSAAGALALALVLAVGALSRWGAARAGETLIALDELADTGVTALERVRAAADPTPGVVIAPLHVGASYALAHWPERWCLEPEDDATLARVLDTLPVRVVARSLPGGEDVLRRAGFVRAGTLRALGERWSLWRASETPRR